MEINFPPRNPFKRVPPIQNFVVPLLLALVAVNLVGSSFFQVEAEEVGVVQRFGRYVRTAPSGLHFKLPLGIETVKIVKTERILKQEFGFQTVHAGIRSEYADVLTGHELQSRRGSELRFLQSAGFPSNSFLHESMMLTGDLNLAVVEWIIQYRYADPYKVLFKVRHLEQTIRDVCEAVMRKAVGDHTVDEVITLSRSEIEEYARQELQRVLDKFDSGVQIKQVVLQNVNPPDEVKPSFNDVNTAKQDKERMINQAWEDYNKYVPVAQGEAERVIREAEGYALQRVNTAEGDAKKFLSVWEEYKKAERVTRKRMYLETTAEIYKKIPHKVILDEKLSGLIPLMNLEKFISKGEAKEGASS